MKKGLALLLTLTLIFACKKEDDNNTGKVEEELKACFTPSGLIVDSGELVNFANCSSGAAAYRWDFGTGTPSEEEDPYVVYQQRGTFPVTLTAWNATRTDSADTTVNIIVGRRSLTSVVIKRYPLTDEQGAAWDSDGTGPDVFLQFGPESNPKQYATKAEADATGQELEIIFTPNIIVRDDERGAWYFSLMDADDTDPQLMKALRTAANPIVPAKEKDMPMEVINSGQYEVELYWELVP